MQKILEILHTLIRYVRLQSKQVGKTISSRPQSDIIVSLSTIPSRLGLIDPTLNSILDQTILPKKIYLNIPKFSRREQCAYEVPQRFKDNPLIQIIDSEKDWGPATKSIPALVEEKDRNSPILVIDDDYVYSRKMIETYAIHLESYKDAVLCLRGWNLPKDLIHKNKIRYNGTDITDFKQADLVEGSSSYLLRSSFFTDHFYDYDSAPDAAFFCDDIWVSGNLALSKVPIYIMPFDVPIPRILSYSTRNTIRLATRENKEDANENEIYQYFKPHWLDLDDQIKN